MSRLLHEILEQPEVLRRTLEAEREHALQFRDFARKQKFRLVVLVARGTSDHSALFGRYLLEITTGIPASLCAPSVHTLYHAPLDFRQTLVVGISQSGEGGEINAVLKQARRRGAFTLGITSEAHSPLVKHVDEVFLVRSGKQRTVAATKSFTGQLLLIYLLASALGSHVTLSGISEIPDRVAEMLKLEDELRQMVNRYRFMRQCAVIARGINYANAREMAFKLKETCQVAAEAFSSADFQYGPIAMIKPGYPVFLFAPPGKAVNELKRLVRQLAKLAAETLVLSPKGMRIDSASRVLQLPDSMSEIYTPIPYIVPAQLFAALLAEVKGLNPDRPRSLHIVTSPL
jgi:glutamine---fructose-6-phosphate transaminase (isomerizing)